MTEAEVIQQLRAIRYARPVLTLSEVARQAGLSRQTIYDAIQGRAGPRPLSAIGQVLDRASASGEYLNLRAPS